MQDQGRQLWNENHAADDRGSDAGQEDGPGRNVQAMADPGLGKLVQAPVDSLHGTIKKLGRQHEADAAQQSIQERKAVGKMVLRFE